MSSPRSIIWTGDNIPAVQAFCGQFRTVTGSIDMYGPRFVVLSEGAYLMGDDYPVTVPVGAEIVKDGPRLVVHEFA